MSIKILLFSSSHIGDFIRSVLIPVIDVLANHVVQAFVLHWIDDELWIVASDLLDCAEDIHLLVIVQLVDDIGDANVHTRLSCAITEQK